MFLFFFCLEWYRCEDQSFEDPNHEGLIIDFDREVSQTINEEEEEDVLSPELERLIAQEEREMKPHQRGNRTDKLRDRRGKERNESRNRYDRTYPPRFGNPS